MLRLLTFSTLYPNAIQPTHGVFVEQRLRHLVATGEIEPQVVAPLPWFPSDAAVFGRYARFAAAPRLEERHGITIHHPRFLTIPKVGMRPAAALMTRGCFATVADVASRCRAQLIDAHYLFPDGVAAAQLAGRLSLPYVLTARGSDVNLIGEIDWCRRAMRRAIEGAAVTIAVSQALRQKILAWGIDANRVEVIRNGVDFEIFKSMPAEPSSSKSAPALRLLSIGKLDDNKGHHLVIDALRLLPDATLTIIGIGPLRGELMRQIRAAALDARVQMVDTVSHAELAPYYTAADMLVLASAREGLPNVVLESLACGTPVVATRVGGIPEAVDSPELGELASRRDAASLADAVRRLQQRSNARERIRELARRFDWRASSLRLAELLLAAARGERVAVRQ
jgi:teichuronic acid biosynthesis glycosyltransferase TuaC